MENRTRIVGKVIADPAWVTKDGGGDFAVFHVLEDGKPQDWQIGELKHIIAVGELARYAGEQLKAGSRVVVEGIVEQRGYKDKNEVPRAAWEVWAEAIYLQPPEGEEAKEGEGIAQTEREAGSGQGGLSG